jgi:hypothetical protein
MCGGMTARRGGGDRGEEVDPYASEGRMSVGGRRERRSRRRARFPRRGRPVGGRGCDVRGRGMRRVVDALVSVL